MKYSDSERNCNYYKNCYPLKYYCCYGPQGPQGPIGPVGPVGPSGTTVLTGEGVPDCSIGSNGDVYIDKLSGLTYFKMDAPIVPTARAIPTPTGTTHLVGTAQSAPYNDIQTAIDAATTLSGDVLELEDALYTLTAPLTVSKSLTIKGSGMSATTIQKLVPSASPDYMITVTASNVIFKDVKIMQNYPSTLSVETVIYINNLTGTGYYFDHCEITSCEFGVGIKAAEYQITNCKFTYAPLASAINGNRYIALYNSNGVNIISNNTFRTQGGNNNCSFIIITNVAVSSGYFQKQLLIRDNIQDPTSPNTMSTFFNMQEYVGNDFQLMFINNTTSLEANVPILFFNPNFNIFRYILLEDNHAANTLGKGLAAIDPSFIGTTKVYIAGNTLINPNFISPWASATNPVTNVIGYRSNTMPVNPSLPLTSCYWLPLA